MGYKYDVFISYASEDKDFVRPVAESLRQQRIAVWFDEFELRPGVGLRQSIDRGLTGCRFGIVVLSPAFFAKAWPQWELDGLLQIQHSRRDQIIIPVWHKLDRSAVEQYSPSLANIVAVISDNDPIRTSQQVLTVLRPRPTAVEVARDRLVEFDFPVPVLSDDWWLDAAVWSAPSFAEGTFQEGSTWGWWGFPLPPLGDSAAEKGERIAWAAMQHSWQEAARERRITQCSEPSRVLEFIQDQPGLAETVEVELDFLLCYAPQLALPGCGGFLESSLKSTFDETVHKLSATWSAPGWLLRHPTYGDVQAQRLAGRYFWPNDPAGTTPHASVIGWVDAAAWLVSKASAWLPSSLHELLRQGIQGTVESEGSQRPLWLRMLDSPSAWEPDETSPWTRFLRQIDPDAQTRHEFLQQGRAALNDRVRHAAELLGLPEQATRISEEIASWQVIERYWDDVASR